MKRTTKFYRKNEEEVMRSLGLKPTKNSGSGWIEKEDGQNDFIICQLKSTDGQSIRVNQKDIRVLEYNASVEHKLPVFAIQFLNTGEIWLMAKPEDFTCISQFIETGCTNKPADGPIWECDFSNEEDIDVLNKQCKVQIKGSRSGREAFHNEIKKKYDKTRSAR